MLPPPRLKQPIHTSLPQCPTCTSSSVPIDKVLLMTYLSPSFPRVRNHVCPLANTLFTHLQGSEASQRRAERWQTSVGQPGSLGESKQHTSTRQSLELTCLGKPSSNSIASDFRCCQGHGFCPHTITSAWSHFPACSPRMLSGNTPPSQGLAGDCKRG